MKNSSLKRMSVKLRSPALAGRRIVCPDDPDISAQAKRQKRRCIAARSDQSMALAPSTPTFELNAYIRPGLLLLQDKQSTPALLADSPSRRTASNILDESPLDLHLQRDRDEAIWTSTLQARDNQCRS